MKLPLQIRAHSVSISEAVKEDIREKAAKLEKFSSHIMGCRVTVDSPHRHQRQGVPYNVHLDLTLPGEKIVLKRQSNEDIYVAIRDVFDAAHQKLEDHEQRLRGEVKAHQAASHARVAKLFPESGYGFLEAPEGHEVYFHKNSVLKNAFSRLKIGTKVRYVEEPGEKGPQASSVAVVGKSRTRGAQT